MIVIFSIRLDNQILGSQMLIMFLNNCASLRMTKLSYLSPQPCEMHATNCELSVSELSEPSDLKNGRRLISQGTSGSY